MRRTAHLSLLLFLVAVVAGLLTTTAQQAQAGGSWMSTVKERYSPGETATLVGYTKGRHVKPRAAFIPAEPSTSETSDDVELLPIGEIKFTRTEHSGYLRLRAFIQFEIPDTLTPGPYLITYDTEEGIVGDLEGGVIYVGMNPPSRIRRHWALDEPEIENLASRAIIALPDRWITAQNLREGGIELAVMNGSRRATTTTTSTTVAQAPAATSVTSTAVPSTSQPEDADAGAPEESPIAAASSNGDTDGFGWLAPLAVLAIVLGVTVLMRRRRFWLQAAAEQAIVVERPDPPPPEPATPSSRIEVRKSDFDAELSDRYG